MKILEVLLSIASIFLFIKGLEPLSVSTMFCGVVLGIVSVAIHNLTSIRG